MKDDLKTDFFSLRRQKGRYAVLPSGYVLDRSLFRWYVLIVGGLLLLFIVTVGFHGRFYKAYVSCPEDAIGGKCDNPLYGACDLPVCEKETLFPGESIGEKPRSTDAAFFALFAPLAIITLFNHFSQETERYKNVRNTYYQQERERRKSHKKT